MYKTQFENCPLACPSLRDKPIGMPYDSGFFIARPCFQNVYSLANLTHNFSRQSLWLTLDSAYLVSRALDDSFALQFSLLAKSYSEQEEFPSYWLALYIDFTLTSVGIWFHLQLIIFPYPQHLQLWADGLRFRLIDLVTDAETKIIFCLCDIWTVRLKALHTPPINRVSLYVLYLLQFC